jgi:ACS family tartrate transporter-like MFS transporter
MGTPVVNLEPDLGVSDVGRRTVRRVALRLLPMVFLLYVIAYIDRVNVAFANLRMSADLGFGDKAFGLGVGIFYLSYVLFEIPGAVIVERWSARKWIARIMISWGIVTILTGFVRTTGEFYLARFFLGAAEASFFPGMIVYLTHWFRRRERCRAIACLYAAVPAATLAGSPLAGWLLGIHWNGLAGWRWLFIVEGIPAVLVGIVVFLLMTDRPEQARWLRREEQEWLSEQLLAEVEAKKKLKNYTILQAFVDFRVLALIAVWFLALCGYLGNAYWIPTFLKRLSGLPDRTVTTLMLVPAVIGIAGTLINGWHSDRTGEARKHAALPLLAGAAVFAMLAMVTLRVPIVIALLLFTTGIVYAFLPVFWSMPTRMLSGTAAAATFGLINSVGQMGGLAGPYVIGFLNQKIHGLRASFGFIAVLFLLASGLILSLKDRETGAGMEKAS